MLGYKLQSPLSRRRRRLKAAAALISNPLYLPNGGNAWRQTPTAALPAGDKYPISHWEGYPLFQYLFVGGN